MPFPITGYTVFIGHPEIGAHQPQFQTIDEAEEFANGLRAVSNLTVSEPIAVIATEHIKVTTCGIKS